MKRQELFIMLSTFIAGASVGVYAYFAGYSPAAEVAYEMVDEIIDDVVIVGEVYGGCERTQSCPSFRVAADGSYRYFFTPETGTAQVLREGDVSPSNLRLLRKELTQAALEVASQETNPALCNSFTDGIDVRYEVSINESRYILDSCGTNVDGDGSLWQALSNIWTDLERVS